MNKHTVAELRQWQALPLNVKVLMTQARIRAWVNEYGEDGVYVAFSGGKDSTVLLDIVRNRCGYKKVPAVFVDVPTQYPELRDFAKTFDNVEIIKPKISFMEVCETYGFPLVSKEVAECVQGARKYLTSIRNEMSALTTERQTDHPYRYWYDRVTGQGKYQKKAIPIEQLADVLNDRMVNHKGGQNLRLARLMGMYSKDMTHPIQANIPKKDRSRFSQEKYKFLLDAPFEVSDKCCKVMKKDPSHRYAKETGRMAITAQMASESFMRTQKWLQNGCNGFHLKNPTSNPMSFWTENDVLQYIAENNLPICSVYGDVVEDFGDEIDGQMDISDLGWATPDKKYKTTG